MKQHVSRKNWRENLIVKPCVICHMMTSLDIRIDCAMTEQLKGFHEYYKTLDSFNAKQTIGCR